MLITIHFELPEPAAAVTQLHVLEEIQDALHRTDALEGVVVQWEFEATRRTGPDETAVRMIVGSTYGDGWTGRFGDLTPTVALSTYREGGSGS